MCIYIYIYIYIYVIYIYIYIYIYILALPPRCRRAGDRGRPGCSCPLIYTYNVEPAGTRHTTSRRFPRRGLPAQKGGMRKRGVLLPLIVIMILTINDNDDNDMYV